MPVDIPTHTPVVSTLCLLALIRFLVRCHQLRTEKKCWVVDIKCKISMKKMYPKYGLTENAGQENEGPMRDHLDQRATDTIGK